MKTTDPTRRLPRGTRRALLGALALLVCAAAAPPAAADRDGLADGGADVVAALDAVAAGRAVIVMRHALAPGTGDPADFVRGDCATQRNLSDEGREQARAIGAGLREALGTDVADVYSSAWCRCLETGRLLGLGDVAPLPALDSFFRERDARDARTDAARDWIGERLDAAGEGVRPAVLVTHQVNVTALTGVYPSSGEMVVFGPPPDDPTAAPEVLATVPPPG